MFVSKRSRLEARTRLLSLGRRSRYDYADAMPDRHTLEETERAMKEHVDTLPLDFAAANALSSLFRAANAVRAELTNRVLRTHDMTWTGFVVLWVVWIWDG